MPSLSAISPAEDPLERETLRLITWRILPLMFAAYCMAYIDRVNVGFAAVPMRGALGIGAGQYGFAAGLFFVGYFLFEIPSNLILARVGARKWIARIMLSWAVVSALNAFVVGPQSFYLVRFMLGVAEAGFFPGLLFFITLWYPQRYHSRIYATLIASTPLSIIAGSLVSVPLLKLDGVAGLAGWQWLFVIQAIPTVLLGIAVLAVLPDRPADAPWLSAAQTGWLETRLAAERARKDRVRGYGVADALKSGRVWTIVLAAFGINSAAYGLILFLPTIISGLGVSTAMTPVINAIPFAVAGLVMIPWARHSDKTGERRWHAAIPAFVCGAALILITAFTSAGFLMVAVTLGVAGVFCFVSVLWALPPAMLSGAAAAGGIALINSVGNLSGFLGPFMMGWLKDSTGSYTPGLLAIGIGPIVSAAVVLMLRPPAPMTSDLAVVAAE
jgi:MFS family permease